MNIDNIGRIDIDLIFWLKFSDFWKGFEWTKTGKIKYLDHLTEQISKITSDLDSKSFTSATKLILKVMQFPRKISSHKIT